MPEFDRHPQFPLPCASAGLCARIFSGWLRAGSLAAPVFSIALAAPPLVQINPTTYQTEHCLFVIDSSVTWSSPATAYNEIYAPPFARLSGAFDILTTQFPASYLSVCYIANTGYAAAPNYINRIYKATGISTGLGSAGLGSSGSPATPQSFASVDFCRYNLGGGGVYTPMLAVFDHELGHAWGAQFFNNISGVGPDILSNGHWLPNSTVDCQLGAGYSDNGFITLNKIHGDPTSGFRWQKVDNQRSNDSATFSEQALYLMGVRESFPTSYVLNTPVYNADLTMSYSSVETYDHAAVLARYGARNPDYSTAPKRFKLGFVYLARDLTEVNAVYQAVEQSIDHFCNGEAIDRQTFRSQAPFLANTKFRASVDGRLADLDGNSTPTLAITNGYVTSADGTALVNFVAADADGPAPTVSIVPAAAGCVIVGATAQLSGLPDGVHFFTLKAVDAGGKKSFGHFVVEVHRPASGTAITTQPAGQTCTAGTSATFSVTGSPGGLEYQWFRCAAGESTWNAVGNGGAYAGASTASLTVTTTVAMDGDKFLCVAGSSPNSVTSLPARLVVNESTPSISTQPLDRSASAGNTVHLTVAASGAPATFGYFYYQWQRLPAGSGTWSDVVEGNPYTGSTTGTLSVLTHLAMSGDVFRCQVTNTAGATVSNGATLTCGLRPAIDVHPVSITVSTGQDATFTIGATGTAPLSYQWYKYGNAVPAATGANLTISNVQPEDAGAYTVTITNAFGLAGSNVGSLTVNAAVTAITTAQDFNHDGQSDLLWRHAPSGWVGVWLMNGTTNTGFVYLAQESGDWKIFGTGDFNHDGRSDILWRNTTTAQIDVWLMDGTASTGFVHLAQESADWKIFGTGDFNADGHSDLLWRNTATLQVGVRLMNGTEAIGFVYLAQESGDWKIFGTGDFNADGQSDILWRNTATLQVGVWLMDGTASMGFVYLANESGEWKIFGTGDFDHDGQSDILWRNSVTAQVGVWLMDGLTSTGFVYMANESGEWKVINN